MAAKSPQKARESSQAWVVWVWDTGGNGFSLIGQEAEEMSIITTYPALCLCLHGAQGVQFTHSLMVWMILFCREVWFSEGDLPLHVGP